MIGSFINNLYIVFLKSSKLLSIIYLIGLFITFFYLNYQKNISIFFKRPYYNLEVYLMVESGKFFTEVWYDPTQNDRNNWSPLLYHANEKGSL